MNNNHVLEIIAACVVSAGGVSGIIVSVISFCSRQFGQKIAQDINQKLDKDLINFKGSIAKKEYISRARYDAELSIYRDLSKAFSQMVRAVGRIVPAEEIKFLKTREGSSSAAKESILEAQGTLSENAAFISKDFVKKFVELLELAASQISAFEKGSFTEEDNKRTSEINEKWEALTDSMREHLFAIDVLQ